MSQRLRLDEASDGSFAQSPRSPEVEADPSQFLLPHSSPDSDFPRVGDSNTTTTTTTPATKKPAPRKRLLSLDILRGLTVFCMIIVNNQPGEKKFWAMEHAEFWGVTPTDFIFPWFLFIMGYAMGIVFSRKCRKPDDPKVLCCGRIRMREGTYWHLAKWGRIIRRTFLLWFLGFFASVIGHKFDFVHVRIPGVLQRIAFCYFMISILLNCVPWISVQCLIILTLHILYIVIMYCYPTPVCGYGVITDTCSAEGFFDVAIFGRNHIYSKSRYFDPEGSVSSLTSLSSTYLGVCCFYLARKITRKYRGRIAKVDEKIQLGQELKESMMVHSGGLGGGRGGGGVNDDGNEELGEMSGDTEDDGVIPEEQGEDFFDMGDLDERKADLEHMKNLELLLAWLMFGAVLIFIGIVIDLSWMQYNKHIWSSSFVFVTAGAASVALGFVALIVDVWGCKWWVYPFWWAGVNPLFMYVVPSYVEVILGIIPAGGGMSLYQFLYHWVFQSWIKDDRWSGAIFGVIFESLFLPWAGLLFWRKCYIKL